MVLRVSSGGPDTTNTIYYQKSLNEEKKILLNVSYHHMNKLRESPESVKITMKGKP